MSGISRDSYGALLAKYDIQELLAEMRQYPRTSNEDNSELLVWAQKGNREALETLVMGNLGLVIAVAKKRIGLCESLTLRDLIQEGVFGLISAIYEFDLNRGKAKFSSYATKCIDNQIMRSFAISGNQEIKRPTNIGIAVSRLKKIYATCAMLQEEVPSKEILKTELKLTDKAFSYVSSDYRCDVSSLNEVTSSSKWGDTELIDLVPDESRGIERYAINLTERELFIYLKHTLSPFHYYVIYLKFVKGFSNSQVGEMFGMERRHISQMEHRILVKLRDKCTKDRIFCYDLRSLGTNREIDMMSMKPMNPNFILEYMFFREYLSPNEEELMSLMVGHEFKYSSPMYARKMDITYDDYLNLYASLQKRLKELYEQYKDEFLQFRDEMLSLYGKKIFQVWNKSKTTSSFGSK